MYWDEVGRAHVRWGGSKSCKYAVPSVLVDTGCLAQWAHARFNTWCAVRGVNDRLPGLSAAPRLKFIAGLQPYLEYDFVMGSSSSSMSSNEDRVLHGTYMTSLWNILQCGTLGESTGTDGSETRTVTPGVYTAKTERKASGYAWPCNALHDNLFYGVMLELSAKSALLKHAWPKHDEYLYAASALEIKKVWLLLNIDIGKGQPRCSEWSGRLELTPPGQQAVHPYCGGGLAPCTDIRRQCWYA